MARRMTTAFAGASSRNRVIERARRAPHDERHRAHEPNAEPPCRPAGARDPRLIVLAKREPDTEPSRPGPAQAAP